MSGSTNIEIKDAPMKVRSQVIISYISSLLFHTPGGKISKIPHKEIMRIMYALLVESIDSNSEILPKRLIDMNKY